MRGSLILDNRGVIVWLSNPLVGKKEDHLGTTAWQYAATPRDAEIAKIAWAHAMHADHTVSYEMATTPDIAEASWRCEFKRLDSHPVVACEYWRVVRNPLAKRELEVAMLFARDWKTGEIADKFCISTKTVETLRRRILVKLGVRGAAGIARWLIRAGLLEP